MAFRKQKEQKAENPLAGVDFASDEAAEEAARLGITAEDLPDVEGPVTVENVRAAHSLAVEPGGRLSNEPYDGPELDGDETPEPEEVPAESYEDKLHGLAGAVREYLEDLHPGRDLEQIAVSGKANDATLAQAALDALD